MQKSYKLVSLSDEKIIEGSYGEVKNAEDYSLKGTGNLVNRRDFLKARAISGGLYDPAIFGLTGYCKCQRVRVTDPKKVEVCPTCGIPVAGSEDAQIGIYGYYVTPFAYITPVMLSNLVNKIKRDGLKVPIEGSAASPYDVIKSICMASYDKDGAHTELTEDTDISTIGLTGLYNLRDDYRTTLSKLIVVPSTVYRPCYPKRNKETGNIELMMAGDTRLGTWLSGVVNFCEFSKERMPNSVSVSDYAIYQFNFAWLMYLYHSGSPVLQGGKFHSVRDLTRSTIESSIRATIAPLLDADMNVVKVPKALAYYALDEQIKDTLMEEYGYTANEALKEILNNTELANKVFQDILKNKTICGVWRNPTLYKNSVAFMYPQAWDEPSIGVPIELCTPLNADFDGDQIAITFITDPEQYKLITENMTLDKLKTYEKNLNNIAVPTHEILLGLYVATDYKHSKFNGKSFNTLAEADLAFSNSEIEFDETIKIGQKKDSYGRFKISDIVGTDLINLIGKNPVDKKNVSKLIAVIYSQPDYIHRLSDLRNFGRTCISLNGMDVPFRSVYDMNDPKVNEILNSDEPVNIIKDRFNEYITDTVKKDIYALPDTNFGDMIKSGARVKDSNLTDIYAPTIKVGADGKVRMEMDNNYLGTSEETFVAKSLENRRIQQLKRGQVPLSGYITRQLVLSNCSCRYDAQHLSPDKKGLLIDAEDALGRTTIDGRVVPEGATGKIRVKSCLNHPDNVVYKDEITNRYNIVDQSNISINMATAFSEFLTQTVLSLKHGKLGGREFTEDICISPVNGEVVETNTLMTIRGDDGSITRFFIPKSARILKKVGARVSKGDVVIELNKPLPTGIFLGKMCSLMGIQPSMDYTYLKSMSPTSLCISPITGTSKFMVDNKGKDYLQITGGGKDVVIPLEKLDELIYLPEGSEYKYGDRICTGVLDLSEFSKYIDDKLELFYQFRNQCREITPGTNVRSELYEVVFKGIQDTLNISDSIKSNKGNIDLLQRMYYGDVKRGINSYFKDSDEVEVNETLILSLLLGGEDEE